MQKTPIFITFPGKKRSNGEKIKKKLLRASTADHDLFFQISFIWPNLRFGVSNAPDTFFFTFSAKTGQITRYLEKKNLRTSTRSHDPFFDNHKIWHTFIYREDVPADTFAKLPVCALITDLIKNLTQKGYFSKNPSFGNVSYSLSRTKYFGTSPKLPVHALIHDP